MKFIRMMSTLKLQATGFRMRFAVWGPVGHVIAFMELVEQHIASFLLRDGIINPDFTCGYEFIDVVVSAGCKIDVENATYKPTVDDPHADAVL